MCKLIANVNQKSVSGEFPSCTGKLSLLDQLFRAVSAASILSFALVGIPWYLLSLTLSTLTAVVVLLLVPLAPYMS